MITFFLKSSTCPTPVTSLVLFKLTQPIIWKRWVHQTGECPGCKLKKHVWNQDQTETLQTELLTINSFNLAKPHPFRQDQMIQWPGIKNAESWHQKINKGISFRRPNCSKGYILSRWVNVFETSTKTSKTNLRSLKKSDVPSESSCCLLGWQICKLWE